MAKDQADIMGGDNNHAVAADQLKAFVERRENLEEEKANAAADIKELNAEVKSAGFDMRAFNEMIKLRKLDKAERDAREAMRDLYGTTLGIFG